MTLRFSPAAQNFIAETGSWKDLMDNGHILIYSGSQPATPDLAVTGTLLATITSSAGTKTNETLATGVVTLSGTTSGSITAFTLEGIPLISATVDYTGSLDATATAIALNINRNPANKLVKAAASGAVITLTGLPGTGTTLNGLNLAATSSAFTTTITGDMGSGAGGSVAGVAAVNALKMDYNAAAGVMTKDATQTWSGTAVSTGTAGWFRYCGSVVDAGSLDSNAVFLRIDGSIATSGAEMNMSSTSVTSGALQTLSTFSFTVPAA